MKWFVLVLSLLLIMLQYRLWFDANGIRELNRLDTEISSQESENARLAERNRLLAAEVKALRKNDAAVEERARTDLGMIKEGETFYMIVPNEAKKAQ